MIGSGRVGLFGVLAALLLAAPLDAQRMPQGRRGGGMDRTQLEQRVRVQMARMIQERLDLSDAQSEQLSEVAREYEARRRELRRSEQATRRRVEALLLEGATDEQEARDLVTTMADLRSREAELFREEQDALLAVISATQLLEMQAIREQIGERIRNLRGPRGDPAGGMRRRGGAAGRGALRDTIGGALIPALAVPGG